MVFVNEIKKTRLTVQKKSTREVDGLTHYTQGLKEKLEASQKLILKRGSLFLAPLDQATLDANAHEKMLQVLDQLSEESREIPRPLDRKRVAVERNTEQADSFKIFRTLDARVEQSVTVLVNARGKLLVLGRNDTREFSNYLDVVFAYLD